MLRRWLLVRSSILICLGALALGLASPGYAAQNDIVGGTGGSGFTIECPPNAFVFGFDIRYGSALDQIKPNCAVVKDGTFTDQRSQPSWTGGNGGKPGVVLCPPMQGVAGLDVYVDPNTNIRRFVMACYLPAPTPTEPTFVGSPEIGGSNYDEWTHCPPFQYVRGLVGRAGVLVDAIGVLCAELPKAAPKPAGTPINVNVLAKNAFDAVAGDKPTPNSCAMANAQCQQTIQNVLGMTPSAASMVVGVCQPLLQVCTQTAYAAIAASAKEDPTPPPPPPAGNSVTVVLDVEVYNNPGGNRTGDLHTGDKVALAGCNGDGWCHVTGDKVPNGDGYVYSGADYNSLGR